MNIEEKVKNLEGCLNQANKRIDSLNDKVKSLNDLTSIDYSITNKRLNKLETSPKRWWQRIKISI